MLGMPFEAKTCTERPLGRETTRSGRERHQPRPRGPPGPLDLAARTGLPPGDPGLQFWVFRPLSLLLFPPSACIAESAPLKGGRNPFSLCFLCVCLLIIAAHLQNICSTVGNSAKTEENLWITCPLVALCQRVCIRGSIGLKQDLGQVLSSGVVVCIRLRGIALKCSRLSWFRVAEALARGCDPSPVLLTAAW